MSDGTKNLQGLIDLANETSSDKRRELLDSVSDLFLDRSAEMGASEVGLIDDILTRVAHDVEMKVRQDLAKKFADIDNAPANIVTMLANDEIAVAGPILLRSSVLKDCDLIDIIRSKGQASLRRSGQPRCSRVGNGSGVSLDPRLLCAGRFRC